MAAETNPERLRLDEAKARQQAWRKWGPYVSERQWGTVREDYSADGDAWSYFPHEHARSRAYRWGEDGIGRVLRRQAALCLRRRAVERQGPDPEGAHVRPQQPRGQSRRGRQGALLLSRRDADLQLRPDALQISAGGISLRPSGAGERAARPAAARVRDHRHRHLRRRPLFRRRYRICQGDADDILLQADRRAIAAPTTPRSTCCRRSGFATPGAGSTDRPKPSLERSANAVVVTIESSASLSSTSSRPTRSVFCENETNVAKALRRARAPHDSTRTASTNMWWTAARTRSARTRAPRRPASTGAPWRPAAARSSGSG